MVPRRAAEVPGPDFAGGARASGVEYSDEDGFVRGSVEASPCQRADEQLVGDKQRAHGGCVAHGLHGNGGRQGATYGEIE